MPRTMDYRNFRMNEYIFIDDSHWVIRIWFFLRDKLDSLFHVIPIRPPITFRSAARWWRWWSTPPLSSLCEIIRFDDQAILKTLAYHDRRIGLRNWVAPCVYLICFMPVYPIVIGFALLSFSVIDSLTKRPVETVGQTTFVLAAIGLTVTISPLVFLLAFLVFVWFASAITDRYFADTLLQLYDREFSNRTESR